MTVFWVDIVRNTFIDFVDFYSLIFQAKGVLWLPVSVLRPSVRPSVCKLYLVRTITRHRFRLESQNFYKKMHSVILALVYRKKGHWPGPSRSFWPFWLRILRNLACLHNNLGNGCELKSQNVHQICIFRFSWLVLNTGVINLTFKVIWPFRHRIRRTGFTVALVYISKGCYTSQHDVIDVRTYQKLTQ